MSGLIGPAIAAGKKNQYVGETEIGISNTNTWKFCGITNRTTVAVYFEVASQVSINIFGIIIILLLFLFYENIKLIIKIILFYLIRMLLLRLVIRV